MWPSVACVYICLAYTFPNMRTTLDALDFSVRAITSLEFRADSSISVSEQTPGDLSRIFWCPTGPFVFLPIHATGFYGTQYSQLGHKASDFVVSSYARAYSYARCHPIPMR
jgi:hypothetical protein